MIKIPGGDKKISIPQNSDLFGSVWYTRNINMDEEGYIKLSSRSVSVGSELVDSSVGIPTAFGRNGQGIFYIVTADSAQKLAVNNSTLSFTQDTDSGFTSLGVQSHGRWWQNKWFFTVPASLYSKAPSTGTWTERYTSLSSSYVHPVELFRSRNTFCIGNGNVVKQITTAYADDTALTIPADYEVNGLAYSNQLMAIATKLSNTAQGQNQEAYLFIWDGATTAANQSYPVGSDLIVAITAYKSSFVLLTRAGELKYFNGGGFQNLATLPYYYLDLIWGDMQNRDAWGDILKVEGDVIYINIGNELEPFGQKNENRVTNHVGGILCYDPKVGLYNRYTPSISPANLVNVPQANVNTTTSTFTKNAGTLYETGNPIKYIDNDIFELMTNKVYYIINLDGTSFKLALTKQDAIDGNFVTFTTTGGTNSHFLHLNLLDYGQSTFGNSGAVVLMGTTQRVYDHLIFGATLYDYDSTSTYDTVCITVPEFSNRGIIVTPKITSQGVDDFNQKVYVKHRPLAIGDRILVKHKDMDVLGLPVSTTQSSHTGCSWTSTTTFTTTSDLHEALAYTGEMDCEIISGAGAGQTSTIVSITYLSGTYTVTLEDALDGVQSGYVSDVIIDNWKKDASIVDDGTTYREVPIGTRSKSIKLKVELEGVETTIEEIQFINKGDKPSK